MDICQFTFIVDFGLIEVLLIIVKKMNTSIGLHLSRQVCLHANTDEHCEL